MNKKKEIDIPEELSLNTLGAEEYPEVSSPQVEQYSGVNFDGYKELVQIEIKDFKLSIGSSTFNTSDLCGQAIFLFNHLNNKQKKTLNLGRGDYVG